MARGLKDILRDCTPPVLWRLASGLKKAVQEPVTPPAAPISYQKVTTLHNMRDLHQGRYAEVYDRFSPLNHFNAPHETRMRIYFASMFADVAKRVPGDFVAGGVSFGVAPLVIYHLLGFETLGKTYHLIDPFIGITADGRTYHAYNTDMEKVREQFPEHAPVVFHRQLMPDCFPLPGVAAFAFVHLNATFPKAESDSLDYLYGKLSPGGIILIDYYAINAGQQDQYDPAIRAAGATIWTLPTGQGVIFKPLA